MASNGFPPGLVVYQEQTMSRTFMDVQPFMPTPGSRQEMITSGILTLTPYEQNGLFKSKSGLYEYNQFAKSDPMRRMPVLVNVQDIHGKWRKHKQILQFLLSGSRVLEENILDPSILPDLMGLQAITGDIHLQHGASVNFEFNDCFGVKTFPFHSNGNYSDRETDYVLVDDIPSPTISVYSDVIDMKDVISVLEECALAKDSARWRQQKILVPHFKWHDATALHDHILYPSSLNLQAVTIAPLQSPEKIKVKPSPKRKNKKATRARDLYKNKSSLDACESLLSLMMDNKRNGKSVMNSLKKSGPELPQLLTQISASIAGTGLAVIFSVIYKMACGTLTFSTPSLLTSSFGVGLFWLSNAVIKLRDAIIYIAKNSTKLGFEEEEITMRVDKSVNDIFFRASALMAVFILRFA